MWLKALFLKSFRIAIWKNEDIRLFYDCKW